MNKYMIKVKEECWMMWWNVRRIPCTVVMICNLYASQAFAKIGLHGLYTWHQFWAFMIMRFCIAPLMMEANDRHPGCIRDEDLVFYNEFGDLI